MKALKKKPVIIVLVMIMAIIIVQVGNNNSHTIGNEFKYYRSGRFLVKDSYDSAGKLVTKQFFNADTMPDGAEIDYYANGKIEKWKWFDPTSKYSYCVVYYNAKGGFDTFVGRPFIGTGYDHKHELCIELINPPNVNIKMGYVDFYNGKVMEQLAYPPSPTDTIAWVILDHYKHEDGHKYMLYYYFVDSSNHILCESSIELYHGDVPGPDKDSFVVAEVPVGYKHSRN